MEEYLHIATVLRPQGIKGEVKVRPLTDSPEDLRSFKRVYIEGVEHKVMSFRATGEFCYLGLSGVPDRNAAELLRDKEVMGLRGDAPAPGEDRYYIADLIGCEVVSSSGRIGVVSDVTPAKTDIYIVDCGEGRLKAFAAGDGVILSVDIEGRRIEVDRKRFLECSLDY